MMKKLFVIGALLAGLAFLLLPFVVFGQGLPLKDGNSSSLADIQACGAENCLRSTGPSTPAGAGFQGLTGSTGEGLSDATGGRMNRAYVTEGNALKVAHPILLWDDTFNATTQNTSKYTVSFTTQAITASGGTLRLNSAAVTTINTNSGIQTFKSFPLFGKSETRANFSAFLTQTPQANNLIEFGLFTAVLSTRVAPLDGVFFRYNAAAELRGVISYNGVETQTAAITAPSINVNHDFTIVTQTNTVLFIIDNVLVGTINLLTDAPAQGQPFQMGTQPLTMRTYIGGSAPGVGTVFQVSDVFVSILGPQGGRTFAEVKAGLGHMGYQGQNGGTMGSTANYANSANPTAAVPTNTTAALGVGLGGQFWETVTLAANTDGIIQSFQNPAGSVTQTPRNLIIKGLTYHCYNQVALATIAFNKQQSLAFGHTAVSLATAESASFTNATTKAPRRLALGVIMPSAAVNTVYPQYTIRFDAPIIIAPGEFVALVSKNVGTVPATGVIAWIVTYDAYFE